MREKDEKMTRMDDWEFRETGRWRRWMGECVDGYGAGTVSITCEESPLSRGCSFLHVKVSYTIGLLHVDVLLVNDTSSTVHL